MLQSQCQRANHDAAALISHLAVVATATIVEATSALRSKDFDLSTLSAPAARFEALRLRVSAIQTDRCQ
jgi:hypothetical protein